jgi:hypothetical protein
VDRAALDVAIELGIPYSGWCPRGGWAEDFPEPPGLLARYPLLRATPLADPAQRTEWNLRDSDAVLVVTLAAGARVSRGTELGLKLVKDHRKPLLMSGLDDRDAGARTKGWLEGFVTDRDAKRPFALGIGGPRESEAPGIYQTAVEFLRRALRGGAN